MSPPRSRSLAALTSLSLLAACAGAPPPAEPSPSLPSASAPAPASAAPVASAAPSASAAVVSAPAPIDPAADREALAVASAICPAAIHHDHGKVQVGCRACPPFGGEGAGPDGQVAVDPPEFFAMESRYPGSFTAPGKDEIAAVFQGCEPHAGNYGGTQIVTRAGGSYKAGAYFSGVHPETCKPYRRADGRDLLVCRWSDAHQSIGFSEVFAFDFVAATPDDIEKGFVPLAKVVDNSFQLCLGMDPDAGVNQGSVLGFRFEDRNKDGRPDVVVEIEHRHTAYSKALEAKVNKACKAALVKSPDDPPSLDVGKLLGAPAKDTLELLSDGQGFKPAAKTARVLKELEKGL